MIAQTPVRVFAAPLRTVKHLFLIVFFTLFLPEAFNHTKIVKVWERKVILK